MAKPAWSWLRTDAAAGPAAGYLARRAFLGLRNLLRRLLSRDASATRLNLSRRTAGRYLLIYRYAAASHHVFAAPALLLLRRDAATHAFSNVAPRATAGTNHHTGRLASGLYRPAGGDAGSDGYSRHRAVGTHANAARVAVLSCRTGLLRRGAATHAIGNVAPRAAATINQLVWRNAFDERPGRRLNWYARACVPIPIHVGSAAWRDR